MNNSSTRERTEGAELPNVMTVRCYGAEDDRAFVVVQMTDRLVSTIRNRQRGVLEACSHYPDLLTMEFRGVEPVVACWSQAIEDKFFDADKPMGHFVTAPSCDSSAAIIFPLQCHWMVCSPTGVSWSVLSEGASQVQTTDEVPYPAFLSRCVRTSA